MVLDAKGSEFVVRLPLLVERPNGPQTNEQFRDAEAKGRPTACRILVVDDNVDSAQSLAMMLSVLRHEVRTAHEAALELVERFQPDLILLDIGMPKMNGYEAARHIRRQPKGGKIVLAALTGWGQEEDKQRASEAGFDHHFTKPVDLLQLQQLLAVLEAREV